MIKEERNALLLLGACLVAATALYTWILRPALQKAVVPRAGGAAADAGASAVDARPKSARRMVSVLLSPRDGASGALLLDATAVATGVADIAEPELARPAPGEVRLDFLPPDITFGIEVRCGGYRTATLGRLRGDSKQLLDLGQVALEPLRRLRGRVTTAANSGAEGAVLQVHPIRAGWVDSPARAVAVAEALLRPPAATAIAAADGSFAFDGLAPDTFCLLALAAGAPPAALPDLDLSLADGFADVRAAVGSTVEAKLSLAGRALAGADIAIVEDCDLACGQLAVALTATDSSGAASFTGAPGRAAFVFAAGGGAAAAGAGPLPLTAGTPLEVEFSVPAQLDGSVEDDRRAGISGARIAARPLDGLALGLETASSSTGTFALPELLPGELELWIEAPRCAPLTARLSLAPTGGAFRAVLQPAGTLVGTVRDGTAPVPGAVVETARPARRTLTDAEGRYRLEGLPAGPVDVHFGGVARAGQTRRAEIQLRAENQLDAELPPGGDVRVFVRSAAGEVVPRARVLVVAATESGAPQRVALYADSGGVARARGLSFDREYVLFARARGSAPARSQPVRIVPDHAQKGLALTLGPGGGFEGRTLDPDGNPLAGVRVRALPAGTDPFDRILVALAAAEALSDETGRFRITELAPGPVVLAAERADRVLALSPELTVRAGSIETGITLALPPGTPVAGRVLWPDGTPAARASVELSSAHPALQPRAAVADAAGRFLFPSPPNGPITLRARAGGASEGEAAATAPAPFVEIRLTGP